MDPTENQGRIAQLAREACREHLRARRDFALNATNTVRQTRAKWIDLCADYGARIEIVYLEPPLLQLLEQNRSRPTAIPESIIQRLLDKLEPPHTSGRACGEAGGVIGLNIHAITPKRLFSNSASRPVQAE